METGTGIPGGGGGGGYTTTTAVTTTENDIASRWAAMGDIFNEVSRLKEGPRSVFSLVPKTGSLHQF